MRAGKYCLRLSLFALGCIWLAVTENLGFSPVFYLIPSALIWFPIFKELTEIKNDYYQEQEMLAEEEQRQEQINTKKFKKIDFWDELENDYSTYYDDDIDDIAEYTIDDSLLKDIAYQPKCKIGFVDKRKEF